MKKILKFNIYKPLRPLILPTFILFNTLSSCENINYDGMARNNEKLSKAITFADSIIELNKDTSNILRINISDLKDSLTATKTDTKKVVNEIKTNTEKNNTLDSAIQVLKSKVEKNDSIILVTKKKIEEIIGNNTNGKGKINRSLRTTLSLIFIFFLKFTGKGIKKSIKDGKEASAINGLIELGAPKNLATGLVKGGKPGLIGEIFLEIIKTLSKKK